MVGEVLGQLVASELVGGHDAVDDAGPLEHGEVPVGGALGQPGLAFQQLGDREGLVDGHEQVHQRPPLRRVALAVVAQSTRPPWRGGPGSSVVGVVVEDQRLLADPEQVSTVGVGQVRLGEHVVGRAARHDPTGQEQEVVGGGGVAEVVGGHQHGPARRPLAGDGVDDVLPRDEVEPGDRLVEQEDVGLLGEALGHEGSLALARRTARGAGRSARSVMATASIARVDGRPVRGPQAAERPGGGVAAHRDRLSHGDGEVLVGLGGLQDVGDAAAARAGPGRRAVPSGA